MDKAIFIPSALIGVVLIAIYAFRCHKAKKEFNQAVMVNAILQASGVVCGILLVAGTINEDARKLLKEIDLYIFIAGMVVLAASLKGIYSDIFLSTKVSDSKSSNKSSKSDAASRTAS
ncbi:MULTISPECIES: threonyl-tRNA synthetase [Shewanella]|uniref:threonyl-tRNA synthetase n=1 Tax=Shewanella TaxID=22 RepID=UPI0030071453